jgi:hypothetical protein
MAKVGKVYTGSGWESLVGKSLSSYQASAPVNPQVGDIWIDSDDDVPSVNSMVNYRWRKIMAGGETSISGIDSTGLTLQYTPGYEQVYLNGVLLYRNSDYIANTGNTITGLTALVAGDTIEITSLIAYAVGDTYTQTAADSKFQTKVATGLISVVPTSTSVGSGSSSINVNGGVSFSGASSIQVNGCFTSSYANYYIVFDTSTTSSLAGTSIVFQYCAGGTPNASGYYYAGWLSTGGGASGSYHAANASYALMTSDVGGRLSFDMTTANPQGIGETRGWGRTSFQRNSDGQHGQTAHGHGHYVNAQNDGFKIYVGSGTFTGTIRIYGYNNGA